MDDYMAIPINEEAQGIPYAQHIVRALLGATDEFRKMLLDLDTRLSTMNVVNANSYREAKEGEALLISAMKRVMDWESRRGMIWDSGAEEASRYLIAVNEVGSLIGRLKTLPLHDDAKQEELLNRAYNVLHVAMGRLEKELVHILVQNKQLHSLVQNSQTLESAHTSFVSRAGSFYSCAGSSFSFQEDSPEETPRDSSSNESNEYLIDLVNPGVVPVLKSIASIMFASDYGQEFCHAFIDVQKDALEDYFIHLGLESLSISIEDLLKIDWTSLNSKMKKWNRAMKLIIRDYLTSEKRLFDQILGDFGHTSTVCFIETSKASMLCLLNFGQAVALSVPSGEKLTRLLDMYEVLDELLPDIDSLFAEDSSSSFVPEFHELLKSLGDSAKSTLVVFQNAIALKVPKTSFPGGGVHLITNYVMNYITTLPTYSDVLNILLNANQDEEDPVARKILSILSTLESNLEIRSTLYKDDSLRHIFMMNNIHYMVRKVRDSKLRSFLGEEWIRDNTAKYQLHATKYERHTWNPVLSYLREEGVVVSREHLKERLRCFTVAFEEVYKNQTGWSIQDRDLRVELQTASQRVIHAYRGFLGRNQRHMKDKYAKYPADDLEKYLYDLYEGASKPLPNLRKW